MTEPLPAPLDDERAVAVATCADRGATDGRKVPDHRLDGAPFERADLRVIAGDGRYGAVPEGNAPRPLASPFEAGEERREGLGFGDLANAAGEVGRGNLTFERS